MSISKKILLISLIIPASFYAEAGSSTPTTNHYHHTSNTTIHTKPAKTEKTLINRGATDNEIKLADAKAALELQNNGKLELQKIGESLQNNMNYLYNAKPFDIEHGLVKGAGIAVALVVAYKLYEHFKSE